MTTSRLESPRRGTIALVLAAGLLVACSGGGEVAVSTSTTTGPAASSSTSAVTPATSASPSTTTTRPPLADPFASFTVVPLLSDTTPYAGPATPTSLDEVLFVDTFLVWNSTPRPDAAAARALLAENGFVVVQGMWEEFSDIYGRFSYDQMTPHPVYVTTDAAYHTWHLTFSKVLRDTERDELLPVLERFSANLTAAARAQRDALAGTPLAGAAGRVAALAEAAAVLAGADGVNPASISAPAREVVTLAREHAAMTASPVTATGPCNPEESPANCVDYTLFQPRSHYAGDPDLERYFVALSLLGQEAFAVDDVEGLRMAALTARLLAIDPALAADWELLYEPVAFLVGAADDYTPLELADAVTSVAPDAWTRPDALADDGVLEQAAAALRAGRRVAVNPEAASVRVLGVRFTLDSYILDQLTWPEVGTETERRVQPSPVDVAAAFGSPFAEQLQRDAGEFAYEHYGTQLADLEALVAARPPGTWGATVYDAWLHAIAPLWAPHGAAYPDLMRTDAWAAKAQMTGFGSYTELKHDTTLYAKQGFAGEGAGDVPLVPPRHWVEPEPVVFARLAATARLLHDGLAERSLLPTEAGDVLTDLIDFYDNLARIAADELAARPITNDDNDYLEAVGAKLESFRLRNADPGEGDLADRDAALVADIFRNTFEILELGNGGIDTIYVLVPNDDGQFQLATGAVYDYREFWRPAGDGRLTDDDWRVMIARGEVPPRPAWTASFVAPNA